MTYKRRPPGGAARKAPAPTCEAAQKIVFESEGSARAAAIARVKRDGRANELAVYECEHCGGWHHTSRTNGANRAVPGRRERPAFSQEKLDRVLTLVRDATGVAVTALFEYPKGDLPAVLAAVASASADGWRQLLQLEREDLDAPELRTALEALRPKLRAMEQLARGIGKVELTNPDVREGDHGDHDEVP